jgi:DNA-binding MarR family transcriptional regulator
VTPGRDHELVARILDDYEAIIRHAAGRRVPEFLALDVTMSQAKVLQVLSLAGRLRMSALAASMGVSLPTMSGLVDRLVDHGLVERIASPDDRRQVPVALTPRGLAVLDAFHEVGRTQLRLLLGALTSDDLRHLALGMRALAQASRDANDRAPTVPAKPETAESSTPPQERTSP